MPENTKKKEKRQAQLLENWGGFFFVSFVFLLCSLFDRTFFLGLAGFQFSVFSFQFFFFWYFELLNPEGSPL